MTSRDQVAAHIRFQLDQLSARNGHHEFEHLCRNLARQRICSNILPATGPVSSGGDQGRDFETFRTYLAESPVAGSSFVGLASQEPVAFACTLQKGSIKNKIESDITVIMNGGTAVDSIHYFCAADLPVAYRHELQKWARNEHEIHLEIYDGQALAELLVDPDVFWIAMRYLNIPSEIYPRTEEKGWYVALRDEWRSKVMAGNFSDFWELKSAIRHATFTESTKPDLPFWIEKLKLLKESTPWQVPLKRRSFYEIAVASLRGLGTIEDYQEELRTYFKDIEGIQEPSDLEDSVVLWMYCKGAYKRGLLCLAVQELSGWRDQILLKLEDELRRSESIARRCLVLNVQGFLLLADGERSEDGIASWQELINLVVDAPLFPLAEFSDRLTQLMKLAENADPLENLAEQVDDLLAARYGQFVVAEKCRDRAVAFYDRGDIIRAIKQIHQAKVNWFAEETLQGSILTMLFVSQAYLELGLAFAAKYYALAAAYTSVKSSRGDIKAMAPRALFCAASCDYLLGAWCGFLDLEYVALATFAAFSREEDPESSDSELNHALFYATVVFRLARRMSPDLLPFISEKVEKWRLVDDFEEFQSELVDMWENKDLDQVWHSLEEQLLGRPFSDVGAQREVFFKALGVTWNFRWENTYEMTTVAEQFLSVLQIILADLAGVDLCLLRTIVKVEVRPANGSKILIEPIASNDSTSWSLSLPIMPQVKGATQELIAEITAMASTLLCSTSLLSIERLHGLLEESFRSGLSAKVFSVERYEWLYREFTTKENFESINRRSTSIPESGRSFKPTPHQLLEWIGGPGPGYSWKSAEEALRNRYNKSIPPIRITLNRLIQRQDFKETIRILRAEGWRDWHILISVMNLTLSYRLQRAQRLGLSLREINELARKWPLEEEGENGIPVPVEEFTPENLRFHLQTSMLATIKNYGLEIPRQTPDFEAIGDFLAERYRYWLDDIEHPNYGLDAPEKVPEA